MEGLARVVLSLTVEVMQTLPITRSGLEPVKKLFPASIIVIWSGSVICSIRITSTGDDFTNELSLMKTRIFGALGNHLTLSVPGKEAFNFFGLETTKRTQKNQHFLEFFFSSVKIKIG